MIDRFYNRPLAILPSYVTQLKTLLSYPEDDRGGYVNFGMIDGVAIIPVHGVLTQADSWSCGTSYGWIRSGFQAAIEDSSVRAIILDIDSPGGEVSGLFDLADMIYSSRGEKPIWSILNESAYSAAYAIASASDKIMVPRTGGVGSVGVVMMHTDFSKALDNLGIAVTFIKFGDRKVDGASEAPLSPEARDSFQSEVDEMGELFVETVARNRKLSVESIKNTQAACFLGKSGIISGLADGVMSPDAAFKSLLKELN